VKPIVGIICGTFLFLASAQTSEAKKWRGIVPLHSTRADVERMLGNGSGACKCSYYLEDIDVYFKYSSGDCKSGGGWNVANDTVIDVTVHPHALPRLADLKLDVGRFKITEQSELPGIFDYYDEEEGFLMEVENGMVRAFYYTPASKDIHLRCQRRRPQQIVAREPRERVSHEAL
jgi:hypothetical protein